jgi:hypothetical protein
MKGLNQYVVHNQFDHTYKNRSLLHFVTIIHYNMSLHYIQLIFLLSICSNYVFGITKLPTCQCECCPGDDCSSQLLVFSVDKCNETTCSFEQCYKFYPKKCGLLPGITNTFCNVAKYTTTNSSITLLYNVPNVVSSSNVILPNTIVACLLFKLLNFI